MGKLETFGLGRTLAFLFGVVDDCLTIEEIIFLLLRCRRKIDQVIDVL